MSSNKNDHNQNWKICTSKNSAPMDSTCSLTAGRTSKALTMATKNEKKVMLFFFQMLKIPHDIPPIFFA